MLIFFLSNLKNYRQTNKTTKNTENQLKSQSKQLLIINSTQTLE
ncbi:unnamed protein product [Paramecium sonneborni]|uniref:Uncharacterized protein n=1 Tax=Paramecium sonneborni TaxID=65129 RepID=A0A8S1KGS8_9CILI|nr:unnamed protein product [Paramecium sonneborni]